METQESGTQVVENQILKPLQLDTVQMNTQQIAILNMKTPQAETHHLDMQRAETRQIEANHSHTFPEDLIPISVNTVASFFYQLKNGYGDLLDSNIGSEPLTYLHGGGNIIPGLEQALANKAPGAHFELHISPADGYGFRDESLVKTIPRTELPPDLSKDMMIEEGMVFEAEATDGNPGHLIVVEVNESSIKFDANHPLAGQDLYYEIDVVDVRHATPAEINAGAVMPVINCGPGCRC